VLTRGRKGGRRRPDFAEDDVEGLDDAGARGAASAISFAAEGVMSTRTEAGVIRPPQNLSALLDLSRFLEHHTEPALLGPDGEQARLPREVYGVLVRVVDALRGGKVITVVPRMQRLTTQEAADFL
jgi:hypothetical protein